MKPACCFRACRPTRDGRFLLYNSRDPQTDWDLWVVSVEGAGKPCVFLRTNFAERSGQISPDGRWVAYISNQSGPTEVFVRRFTAPGASTAADCARPDSSDAQWQVSTAGGIYPRWRPDGKELFYIGPNGQMMAAPVAVVGATIEVGTPVALFDTRIWGGGTDNQQGCRIRIADSRHGLPQSIPQSDNRRSSTVFNRPI
jgi:hypothetical protein